MLIDRRRFKSDKELGGVKGSVLIGGRSFKGWIQAGAGDMERAWQNAERVFAFVAHHFPEIERKITTDLVPELDHWVEEEVEPAALAHRIVEAVRKTKQAGFNVYDSGTSLLYFDGPDFVGGHYIEVQFDKEGHLVCVGLAG